jgi:hypothetical protein
MEEITWQTPEPWASEVQPGKSLPAVFRMRCANCAYGMYKGKFSKGY